MEANEQLQQQQNFARSHDSVRSWLQKISEYQQENATALSLKQEPVDVELIASAATATGGTVPSKKPSRVVSYNDLPYMGEMTLDNSKPRRGRKPKKADICHLIYKNYGTILPGTPKDMMDTGERNISADPTVTFDLKKSDLQSKLISSLLEKRLTQDSIRLSPAKVEATNDIAVPVKSVAETVRKRTEEPLNLCVRDISDTLTVSSGDTDTDSLTESTRTSPLIPPSETDALLAANLKMALPNFQSAMMDKPDVPLTKTLTPGPTSNDGTVPSNYVYWPSAGVFIHPMALYYQKMVDAGTPPALPHSGVTSTSFTHTSLASVSTPTASIIGTDVSSVPSSKSPLTKRSDSNSSKTLVPKNISQLIKQEKQAPSTSAATNSLTRPPSELSSASSKSTTPVPQKRKRSAIFIPPMPPDTSSNHATEVSICKFKFTGGAKPSLQEKKMLSVDSGGNFRYYSGTGDKSMRGYEFFPRESLQQSSLLTASSSGAFLNTPGEKISIDLPPPSHGLSNELLQLPELTPANCIVSGVPSAIISPTGVPSSSSAAASTVIVANQLATTQRTGSAGHLSSDRRKRKSRRSLQREKLEKTFKEKGFLIQTQQLESAEGATYCKFRQLRKFTRYLFRSWKDYLPGDLQQGQQGLAGGGLPVDATSAALLASKSNKLITLPASMGRDGLNSIEASSISPSTGLSPAVEIMEH